MHAVIQSRMQTISMIGSCRELQWNMQSISTTASSAADHQRATTRTNSLHPPPPKIKSNRRFNALEKEVQNTFDTKHKERLTHYKDTMRPQQAIRSNTEHICTTMFIRRRILRVLPLLLEYDSLTRTASPGASFAPMRKSTLGSRNVATMSTRLHTARQVNAAHWCAATLTNFLHKLTK